MAGRAHSILLPVWRTQKPPSTTVSVRGPEDTYVPIVRSRRPGPSNCSGEEKAIRGPQGLLSLCRDPQRAGTATCCVCVGTELLPSLVFLFGEQALILLQLRGQGAKIRFIIYFFNIFFTLPVLAQKIVRQHSASLINFICVCFFLCFIIVIFPHSILIPILT